MIKAIQNMMRKPWQTCVVIVFAGALFLALRSRTSESSFIIDFDNHQYIPSNLNFKVGITSARERIGCEDEIFENEGLGNWQKPILALQHFKPPQLLPDYKNPCWMSTPDERGDSHLTCMPYFYLAGFPKSATTDLHTRLLNHPLIVGGREKEPQYMTMNMFSTGHPCTKTHEDYKARADCFIQYYASEYYAGSARQIQNNRKKPKENSIRQMFKKAWDKLISDESKRVKHPMITVDSSATTVFRNWKWRSIAENQGCPEPVVSHAHIITKINPKVRILLILRDPTDRLYSQYLSFRNLSQASVSDFHQKVEKGIAEFKQCTATRPFQICLMKNFKLPVGIYHVHVDFWLRLLPRSQVLVLHTESYKRDVSGTLAKVFRFLDLPPLSNKELDAVSAMKQKNTRDEAKVKLGPMLPKTEKLLRDFYSEHNEKLARLLQDDRFAWRR